MMFLTWLYQIRSYLRAYGRYIKYRWLISLIWAVALAGLVFFYGETLAFGTWRPFASQHVRTIAVIVIFLIWAVWLVYRLVQAKRTDQKLIEGLTAEGKVDPARAAAEDVAELRGRLKDALKTLRKTLGRGAIYQLPWYLLIGAPGAGKTTALVNSGLHFPLAEENGPRPIQGVAGTRHCDWWFTNEGILIDTAGRYTSQDGEQETDKAGWTGFLKLLRKHRRRQPLNGAIVVIGLDDIMNADPTERLKQGRIIRRRLRELDEEFKLRVPAYLVLTKADRLAGFQAFFENLDRTSREQVWGVTLPLPASGIEGGDLADRFGHAIDALVERLNALLLDRLQAEPDGERRCEVFAFPSQVALIAEPLHEMLGEMAAASRFDPPPRIRGIYLASAQQDEAPLDLVTRAAVAHFGVELPRLAEATRPGTKSFFLARLLRDVIFGEASLISTDPRRDRRDRIVRWAGAAVIALVAVVLAGIWGADYLRQEGQLAAVEARLALYSPAAAATSIKNVEDHDFRAIAPVLDQAADLNTPYRGEERASRLALPPQRDKVLSGYDDLYRRALNDFLLPRLLVKVEATMREKPDAGPYVMENVRVYPMLGGRIPMDAAFARKTLDADIERDLTGKDDAPVRAALDRHIAALVAGQLTPIALDDRLITNALANEHDREQFAAWQSEGGSLCENALTDHYPFSRVAAKDMTAEDFAALFGPNGAFATFFKNKLESKVNTATSPWTWKKGVDRPNGSTDSLRQFEAAAAIRTAFFNGPKDTLQIPFEVTPVGLNGDAMGVTLASDGQQVAYYQGARASSRPVALTWPGQLGVNGAEVNFQTSGGGGADSATTKRGLWGLFRLLDAASLQTIDASTVRATFASSVGAASFQLHVDTPFDPFDLKALRAFHCPKTL